MLTKLGMMVILGESTATTSLNGDGLPIGSNASGFVEVPVFTGEDLRSWLDWMENRFLLYDYTDLQKLAMAHGFIYGEAEAYIHQQELFFPSRNWQELKKTLLLRFGRRDDPERIRLCQELDLEMKQRLKDIDRKQSFHVKAFTKAERCRLGRIESSSPTSDLQSQITDANCTTVDANVVLPIPPNVILEQATFHNDDTNPEKESMLQLISDEDTRAESESCLPELIETQLVEEKFSESSAPMVLLDSVQRTRSHEDTVSTMEIALVHYEYSQVPIFQQEPCLKFCNRSLDFDVSPSVTEKKHQTKTLVTYGCVTSNAHQMFEVLSLKAEKIDLHKEHDKLLKSWKFKYKHKRQQSRMPLLDQHKLFKRRNYMNRRLCPMLIFIRALVELGHSICGMLQSYGYSKLERRCLRRQQGWEKIQKQSDTHFVTQDVLEAKNVFHLMGGQEKEFQMLDIGLVKKKAVQRQGSKSVEDMMGWLWAISSEDDTETELYVWQIRHLQNSSMQQRLLLMQSQAKNCRFLTHKRVEDSLLDIMSRKLIDRGLQQNLNVIGEFKLKHKWRYKFIHPFFELKLFLNSVVITMDIAIRWHNIDKVWVAIMLFQSLLVQPKQQHHKCFEMGKQKLVKWDITVYRPLLTKQSRLWFSLRVDAVLLELLIPVIFSQVQILDDILSVFQQSVTTNWAGLMLTGRDNFWPRMFSSLHHDLELSDVLWQWFCFELQPYRSYQTSSPLIFLSTSLGSSLFLRKGVYKKIFTGLLIMDGLMWLLSPVCKTGILVKYLRNQSETEYITQCLVQMDQQFIHTESEKGNLMYQEKVAVVMNQHLSTKVEALLIHTQRITLLQVLRHHKLEWKKYYKNWMFKYKERICWICYYMPHGALGAVLVSRRIAGEFFPLVKWHIGLYDNMDQYSIMTCCIKLFLPSLRASLLLLGGVLIDIVYHTSELASVISDVDKRVEGNGDSGWVSGSAARRIWGSSSRKAKYKGGEIVLREACLMLYMVDVMSLHPIAMRSVMLITLVMRV